MHLIMLSFKQRGIKYRFFSLWYDSTWNWKPFSRAIGKHSNYYANEPVKERYFLTLGMK